MPTVRELMSEGVLTCEAGATAGDIAALLVRHRIHAVFVVAAEGGRPIGVLSDHDLLAGEWLGDDETGLALMTSVTAGDLMSAPVLEIDAGADLTDAARVFVEERVSRLLVLEDGQPAGVLSVSDVIAAAGGGRRRRGSVADVMSYGIVVCQPDAPLTAAARAMTERRSRSIVVVDIAGRPVGVITGHDIVRVLAEGSDATTVGEVMSRDILGIAPDATLREAADRMLEHAVHRLVVLDPTPGGAAPIGIISTSDIVGEMAQPGSVWRSAAGDRA
jgi:CBS domain-containing protein